MNRICRLAVAGVLAAQALFSTAGHAQIVINEVDYDQPSSDTAEFIELYNAGDSAQTLADHSLRFINGVNGGAATYAAIALPALELAAGDFYVVCADAATVPNCDQDIGPDHDALQNGAPDAIALLDG